MLRTPFLLVLMIMSVGNLMAITPQKPPTLVQRIEAVVKAQVPDWALSKKEIEGRQTSIHWKGEDGKKGISVLIYEAASTKEATEMLKYWVWHISVGPGAKLENLGDEAYFWKTPSLGTGTIQFRKSNVYVNMSASSPALVEEMARRVAETIPGK